MKVTIVNDEGIVRENECRCITSVMSTEDGTMIICEGKIDLIELIDNLALLVAENLKAVYSTEGGTPTGTLIEQLFECAFRERFRRPSTGEGIREIRKMEAE